MATIELLTEEEIEKTYNSKTKLSIITSIVNTYIYKTYLSSNLWMLSQIVDLLHEVETNAGKSQKITKSLCTLVSYIKLNKPIELIISASDKSNLEHLLYTLVTVPADIEFMREYVDDTTYSYLGILYNNIRGSSKTDVQKSLAIVEKIIAINASRELDGYDIMFLFLLKLVELVELLGIDDKIKQYIELSKDIFYYRLRKKDRMVRVNIIYYSVYILITKKVKNKPLVSGGGVEYLNVVPQIDQMQINEMDYLRARNRVTLDFKNININTKSEANAMNQNVHILKN